ncbi:hypothetical protein NC652_028209 [Populus alba x Populus x berolinensis]|nr:hypothetical protein NC652_028209 [Populus alba x Populus x berolinensis]
MEVQELVESKKATDCKAALGLGNQAPEIPSKVLTNGDDDAPLAEPCPGGPRGLWHLEKLVGIAVVAV